MRGSVPPDGSESLERPRGGPLSKRLHPLPSRGVVARQSCEQYGALVDSNDVHEEIRDLSRKAKGVIEKHFQKHATSEAQILQGIQRFGPSAQSKKILNRENDAAMLALKTGVYAVWRCEQPKLSGANTDFCARLGYKHVCFCGHTLEEHAPVKVVRGRVSPPKCQACECGGFNYVPNEPEEIGEGWLTRRRNWDPAQWSAKCRCGHGHKQHDPRTQACRQCGCGMYASHFLCVVCDRDGEAHTTIFELEEERARSGLPVREAFFPLMTLDWSVRELVLNDPTGGGALTAPVRCASLESSEKPSMGAGRGVSRSAALPKLCAAPEGAPELPEHCGSCAAIFRSPQAKFCSNCGKSRQ